MEAAKNGERSNKNELRKRALPEVLGFADGTAVNTPELWGKRREEIRENLQEECYGRMPRTGAGKPSGRRYRRIKMRLEEKPHYGQ